MIQSEKWSYAHGLEIAGRAFRTFSQSGKLTRPWRARFGRDNANVPAYFVEKKILWVMARTYTHRGPTNRVEFIPWRGISGFKPTIKAGLKKLRRSER